MPDYSPDALFSRNLHIHTCLSRCGAREMTLEAIVRAAEAAGLEEIAVTDHIHPYETPKLRHNLPELHRQRAALHTKVRVLIGAELSAHGTRKYTLQYTDRPAGLEFALYAHNHYHMRGWEQPEDRSETGYKNHCLACMERVIRSGRADCMAHPFADKYIVREFEDVYPFTIGCITSRFTENEIGDLMALSLGYGVKWELNTTLFRDYTAFLRRYFYIGREVGVTFTVGSDAHRPEAIGLAGAKAFFQKYIL